MLSTQHLDGELGSAKVREVVEPFIREALGDLKIADDCNWYINPTGKFVIGGPDGDAGLTGRKIIVDTYGGAAPHGGGAFSGKDTTKVDRSAAYAARYLAKNVVAAKLAERCTIQLSYAIGVAQPLSVYVDLHGTGKVDEAELEEALREVMDLSPRGIRQHLDLNKPIYAKTSAYGHFGRKRRPRRLVLLGEDRPRQGAQGSHRGLTAGAPMTVDGRPQPRRPKRSSAAARARPMRPLQAGALEDGLPPLRRSISAQRRRQTLQTLFERRCRRSGWRSASAAASICCSEAAAHPDTGFIGVEPFVNGDGQADGARWRRRRSPMCASMTTTRRDCSTGCPTRALSGIDLLYPDPWPKKKHWKRRFVSPDNLDRFARVLQPGGTLPLRLRHRHLCELDAARTAARTARSSGRRRSRTTGTSPIRAGRARATRPRRCARGDAPAT